MKKWHTSLAAALFLLLGADAWAHDPSTAKSPEEARAFDFYQSWNRPPDRNLSCCGMNDCHIVEVKKTNGHWYFLDKFTYSNGWREIPDDRLEQNTKDPRESPDGNSHACFTPHYVLCVVLGSGQ